MKLAIKQESNQIQDLFRLEHDDDVEMILTHSELVQIHWRPELDVETRKHKLPVNGADKNVIDSQMKLVNKMFPHLKISEEYGFQTHELADGGPCEYNPYEGIMKRNQQKYEQVVKEAKEKLEGAGIENVKAVKDVNKNAGGQQKEMMEEL